MLAEVSGDPLLIKQFQSGADIHCLVGHMLTGWSVERIKEEKNLRKMVKNMHFGIIYGLGRNNLYPYVVAKIRAIDGKDADLTGITPTRLAKLYDRYFEVYVGVKKFMNDMRRMAEVKGYVETLFGFRREIKQSDDSRTTYWANQAVNSPIQGTAHQLLLIAMALLHTKPKTYSKLQVPVMEVHDALDFFVKLRDLPLGYKQVMHLLTTGVTEYAERAFGRKLRVPLLAEGEAGFTLGTMCSYHGEPPEVFLPMWRKKYAEVKAKGWGKLLAT